MKPQVSAWMAKTISLLCVPAIAALDIVLWNNLQAIRDLALSADEVLMRHGVSFPIMRAFLELSPPVVLMIHVTVVAAVVEFWVLRKEEVSDVEE